MKPIKPIKPLVNERLTTEIESTSTVEALFQAKINRLSTTLNSTDGELMLWINHLSTSLRTAQVEQKELALFCLVHLLEKYALDPFLGDVQLWQEQEIVHIGISMSGLMRLLHRQPQFYGISFTESNELINGIPTWMECAIVRRDLAQAIVAREYFIEVKQEATVWQEMPRRMLKHRATQQAARYAFGIEFHQSFSAKESTSAIPSTRAYVKTPQAEPNGRMKALKSVLTKENNLTYATSINATKP